MDFQAFWVSDAFGAWGNESEEGKRRTSCCSFIGQYPNLLLQFLDAPLSFVGDAVLDMRNVGAAFWAGRREN